MEKWEGLVAVVTGASAGIGMCVTVKLAQNGMKVAALARRADKLNELVSSFKGKGMIRGYTCDVSDDEAVTNAFAKIEKEMGPIRVLVNNAGITYRVNFTEIKIDEWKNVFNTNVFGMFSGIREVMNSVKKRKSNDLVHIINVNSLAGQYQLPASDMAVYSSTKHCVTLLTRGLIKQISEEKLNIRVTSLSPGVVETELRTAAGIEGNYSSVPSLSGEDIAEATVAILSVPQNVIISELTIKPQGETL